MNLLRKILLALVLGIAAVVPAVVDSSPVQAAEYTCSVTKVTWTYPDYGNGSCKRLVVSPLRSFRIVVTCTSGAPSNQVTRYGPWTVSHNRGEWGPFSRANCTGSHPYILGAYMQSKTGNP